MSLKDPSCSQSNVWRETSYYTHSCIIIALTSNMGVATRYPVNWAANLSASCHIDHIALHSKNRKVLKRIILIETLLFVRRVDLPLKQTKRRLQQSKKRIRKKSNISSIHSLYNPKFQSFNSPTKQLYYYSTKNKTSKEKETNRESINPKKKKKRKNTLKTLLKTPKRSNLYCGEESSLFA